jgi:hypothetical protein
MSQYDVATTLTNLNNTHFFVSTFSNFIVKAVFKTKQRQIYAY